MRSQLLKPDLPCMRPAKNAPQRQDAQRRLGPPLYALHEGTEHR